MKLLMLTLILLCFLVQKSRTFLIPTFISGRISRHSQQGLLVLSASRDANQQAAIFASESKFSNKRSQTWRDAPIVSSRQACPSGKSTLIEIQVDTMTLQEYTTPGQFLQLRPSDDDTIDPIFLAISSAPNTENGSTLQFLVKMSPRLPWLQETLVVGKTVKISPVMGRGYPLKSIFSPDNTIVNDVSIILLAAAGSGIAPLKACIESGLLSTPNQEHTTKTVYYGEWTEDDLCFTEVYDDWKNNYGVTVTPVLSRTPDARGYIQDILPQDGLVTSDAAKSTIAVLCGMDDMVESCTRVLTDLGVEKERILLNL